MVIRCFETPNVIALNEKLAEFGYKVCFMAEYFLPDVNKLTVKSVRNAIRCGFRPAWVELTARESEFVDDMNK